MESGLPVKKLNQILTIPSDALQNNKYAIIWDKQGSVGTFMGYKMQFNDLMPDKAAVSTGSKTVE